jgi:hypothetical protein
MRFSSYKANLAKEVLKKNEHLQKVGYTAYLQEKGMASK